MQDDSIRTLLARLKRSSMIPTEPGLVAILRSRVVDGGGDPDGVERWVEDHGGYVARTRPAAQRKKEPGEIFYAVPRSELAGESPAGKLSTD